MNAGNVAGVIILVGGSILIKKYVYKRIEKEVKKIDNISYPKYDQRQRRETGSGGRRETGSEGRSKGRNPISIRFGI